MSNNRERLYGDISTPQWNFMPQLKFLSTKNSNNMRDVLVKLLSKKGFPILIQYYDISLIKKKKSKIKIPNIDIQRTAVFYRRESYILFYLLCILPINTQDSSSGNVLPLLIDFYYTRYT